ncbi:hypothetical protein tb265_17990 [Gemmatimonadetes bacterium T265]|nr:hypothetical protein tb265_17990 [Gemmatimonadetes bacterium T265]
MRAAILLCTVGLTACSVEYRPAKTGEDSARAVAALAAARAESAVALRRANTRVDTVVRVDTIYVRDTLPALGEPPADSLTLKPAVVSPATATVTTAAVTPADLDALRARGLLVPVQGVRAADVPDTFNERRGGGTRPHEALDILAPRGTPVLAADDGRVAKLFTSKAGGLTVYVLAPGDRLIAYYAHLDRYRDGLAEGAAVRRGDVLGYVGSTGDADAATPHLHFAVAVVNDPRRWWAGTPIDPKPFLR